MNNNEFNRLYNTNQLFKEYVDEKVVKLKQDFDRSIKDAMDYIKYNERK